MPSNPTRSAAAVFESAHFVMTEQTARANSAMARYARSDDERDFDELYSLLYARLFRHCLALCGPNDAEELVQDVLLKMHGARARFVEAAQGSVVSWAFAIARRTHCDRIRHRKRRPELSVDPIHLENGAAAGGHPETVLAERALEARFEHALGALSENLRSAFVLVKLEGLSCAAASSALGVSVDALKQRVHRASDELKASLVGLLDGSRASAWDSVSLPAAPSV